MHFGFFFAGTKLSVIRVLYLEKDTTPTHITQAHYWSRVFCLLPTLNVELSGVPWDQLGSHWFANSPVND